MKKRKEKLKVKNTAMSREDEREQDPMQKEHLSLMQANSFPEEGIGVS